MTFGASPDGSDVQVSGPRYSHRNDLVPVLWLCGPPGVGKTSVAWEIYSQLAQGGTEVGYVDIDQLGMCSPEPAADPGCHRMKAENLGALVTAFQVAGARCVVVSGVVDPTRGVYADLIPQAALTVVRLRADPHELTRRIIERQGDATIVADVLAVAEALDSGDIGDVCIDTTGRPVGDVVRLAQEHTAGWTASTVTHTPVKAVESDGHVSRTADGSILWLCGATGVGKSTVGFTIYMKTVFGRQIPGAYIDLDQIGFFSPTPPDDPANHRVKARILAALWQTFRAAGAKCLTIVGPAEDATAIKVYAEALPAATITVCQLRAGRDELTRRILSRGKGGSWAQPGDPLKGQHEAHLHDVANLAAAQAEALDDAAVGDVRIDTDEHTVEEIADAIVTQTGWPERTQGHVTTCQMP